jgi:4-amino-4-deoxy-L-arabinose transferase-like glycosyltransferase
VSCILMCAEQGHEMKTLAVPTAGKQSSLTQRLISSVTLSYLFIGVAALVPRIIALGLFVNADESNYWLQRSDIFLQALRSGDFAATAITTHPGVTTMWLGAAGLVLQRTLFDSGLVRDESFTTILALIRTPLALFHVGAILLGYGLLRRLLNAREAMLGGLLWAVDPFVIGYSRMLHVDALLATFATLSLLAACTYWHHGRQFWSLALSAVCGALAILSKSPGIVLLPMIGAFAVAAAWREEGAPWHVTRIIRPILVWCAIYALTILLVWPATWSAPYQVYELLRLGVEAEADGEHQGGNFFLGRRDDRPGLLFYPVSLAIRLTPWTMLGLLALPFLWRRLRPSTQHDLAGLSLYVLVLTIGLSIFTKKLNRYLVPAFPALDVLAAVGLIGICDWLRTWGAQPGARGLGWGRLVGSTLLAVLMLLAPLNAAYWHPYGIDAFNQALGGLNMGARTVALGSGEAQEQVAAWLNEQPNITGVTTISALASTLQPYLREGAYAIDVRAAAELPENAGYVVVYINRAQKPPLDEPLRRFHGVVPPLHIVRVHGLPFAWIYEAPPKMAVQHGVDFGTAIRLHGSTAGEAARGEPLVVQLSWLARAASKSDYMLFGHVIGPDGQRYGQVDIPYATSTWIPGKYQPTEVPIVIGADAPPGHYRVTIGLYQPGDGQRLPLGSAAADPALDGPDALVLYEFELP